jgi:hypothetical protein
MCADTGRGNLTYRVFHVTWCRGTNLSPARRGGRGRRARQLRRRRRRRRRARLQVHRLHQRLLQHADVPLDAQLLGLRPRAAAEGWCRDPGLLRLPLKDKIKLPLKPLFPAL